MRSQRVLSFASRASHRAQTRSLWFQSEQVSLKRRRAQRIDWWNPGDRLKSVPDEVLYAMPPPPPAGARTMQQHRKWLLRTRIPVVLAFLFAAGHWTVSSLGDRRSLASEVERTAPWLGSLLAKLGVFPRYPEAEGFDRDFAFERVFLRYKQLTAAASSGQSEWGIPLREAVGLCAVLLSAGAADAGEGAAAGNSGWLARLITSLASVASKAGDAPGPADEAAAVLEARAVVGRILAQRADGRDGPLDAHEAKAALAAAAQGLPDRAAYLTLAQRLGVHAVSRDTAESVGALFDLVALEAAREARKAAAAADAAAARRRTPRDAAGNEGKGAAEDPGVSTVGWLLGWLGLAGSAPAAAASAAQGGTPLDGDKPGRHAAAPAGAAEDPECLMTVPLLAALCEELGLGFREAEARDALTETWAIRSGRMRMAPTDWLVIEPAAAAVRYRKKHGEQSAEDLAKAAEEVARASSELSGVDPTPGTDWGAGTAEAVAGSAGVGAPSEVSAAEEERVQLRRRSRLVVRSHLRVPMLRSEFINFMSRVGAGMGEDELVRYCDVFMYMAGLRGQAGVAGPGQGTQ